MRISPYSFYFFLLFTGCCADVDEIKSELNDTALTSTTGIQKLQAEFDIQYFDKKYFDNDADFEKLRHILLHLIKTVGKVATYCEAREHGKQISSDELVDAALPDLYLHALQIATLFDVDLGKKYAERIAFLVERNQKSSTVIINN